MKKLVIGIDLGTTYSCAAVLTEAGTVEMSPNKDTGLATTPSVMLIDSEKNIKIGRSAKNLITGLLSDNQDEMNKELDAGFYIHPENEKSVVEIAKRHIGTSHKYLLDEHSFNPTFVSGAILKVIKKDVEISYGQNIDSAVITVPANFNNQQRQETMNAAELSGLNVDFIINEPTAAALAYSMSSQIDGIYAVYDFGGGTFDCSIVETKGEEITILGFAGVKKLGGRDFDRKLLGLVQSKYKEKSLKDLIPKQFSVMDAERYKKNLSTMEEVEIFIDGVDIVITRKEFEESISTLVTSSLITFDTALEDAKIEVDNIMDVILVGGSSRVPLIAQELKNKIGKEPKVYGNPDETVAKGAAIYAALKNRRSLNINQKAAIAGLEVNDITNVSLGQRLLDINDCHVNQVIIEKGSRVPAQKSRISYINGNAINYAIINRSRPDYKVSVTEGLTDTENSDEVEVVWDKHLSAPTMTESDISSLNSDPSQSYRKIKTTFKINSNQVFEVKVVHVNSNEVLAKETLSMKEGSLAASSGLEEDDLDDFEIK